METVYKEKYRYYRDSKNRPIVTECWVTDDIGGTGIGVAICSDRDIPNKRVGRTISLQRALAALWEERTFLPIKRENIKDLFSRVQSVYGDCPEMGHKIIYMDGV